MSISERSVSSALIESLVTSHYGRLVRRVTAVLGSSGDVDTASDIVQHAFLKLQMEQVAPRAPEAWLMTVAVRQAKNFLRYRGFHPMASLADMQLLEESVDGVQSPDGSAHTAQLVERVLQVVTFLEPVTQAILMYRFVDDLTATDIAVKVRMSAKAVEHRIARAFKEIRERLPSSLMDAVSREQQDND